MTSSDPERGPGRAGLAEVRLREAWQRQSLPLVTFVSLVVGFAAGAAVVATTLAPTTENLPGTSVAVVPVDEGVDAADSGCVYELLTAGGSGASTLSDGLRSRFDEQIAAIPAHVSDRHASAVAALAAQEVCDNAYREELPDPDDAHRALAAEPHLLDQAAREFVDSWLAHDTAAIETVGQPAHDHPAVYEIRCPPQWISGRAAAIVAARCVAPDLELTLHLEATPRDGWWISDAALHTLER